MPLDTLRDLLAEDLEVVDRIIHAYLASDIPLIPLLGNHVIASGGKRVRPMVLLAAARMFGYEGDRHTYLAAVIEFIHTATLMHDDVVDASQRRRTQPTANAVWGSHAPVLVGDFLFARSFQAMIDDGDPRVMEILAATSRKLVEGELLQLQKAADPDIDEADYLRMIDAKTATLFEAAAQLGAVINRRSCSEEHSLAAYGHHLGMAFQLIDDCLDYSASEPAWGKDLGEDLAEGKPTLPTIYALAHADPDRHAVIRRALQGEGGQLLEPVKAAIESTQAIEYTRIIAQKQVEAAKTALNGLPDNAERRALEQLADFVADRGF